MELCAITAKVQVLDVGGLSSQDYLQDGPWGCKAREEGIQSEFGVGVITDWKRTHGAFYS